MIVALGALHTHPEKDLRNVLRDLLVVGLGLIEVDRGVFRRRAGGDVPRYCQAGLPIASGVTNERSRDNSQLV